MQRAEVLEHLKNYISFEVLNGSALGLDDSTPLLEWGILNSLELIRILTFVQERFNVQVPGQKVVAEHFKNMNSITDLVLDLAKEQLAQTAKTETL